MEMFTDVLVMLEVTCVMLGASCRCLKATDNNRMAAACEFNAPGHPRESHGDSAYLGVASTSMLGTVHRAVWLQGSSQSIQTEGNAFGCVEFTSQLATRHTCAAQVTFNRPCVLPLNLSTSKLTSTDVAHVMEFGPFACQLEVADSTAVSWMDIAS